MNKMNLLKSEIFSMILQFEANQIQKKRDVISSSILHLLIPFLFELKERLNDIQDGEEIFKLLENSTFICQSLSNVGIDMKNIFQDLFLNRIYQYFKIQVIDYSLENYMNSLKLNWKKKLSQK
jgi:hypothetical protein